MKPRLLFLSHRLPYPPHSGAAIRTYNVLRELSRDYAIDALCFDRVDRATASRSVAERVGKLAPFARCEVFPIPQQDSRIRLAWDHLRSLLTRKPYTWYVHDSEPFLARLSALLSENSYHVIHVDSLDLVRVLELLPLGIVACTHHNIESELLTRRSARESLPQRKWYLALQARLVRRMERYWAPRIALNLCTSQDDAAMLEEIAPGARIVIAPNGVDDGFFKPAPVARDGGLVFVGGTSWYPNKDALNWFVADILPALRSQGVTCPVAWVGRVTDSEQRELSSFVGLQMTGYVDDVRPYLARANAFIAPIRVGGGTRLKILDAWAMATPIVGTRAAMEGLDAADGKNFLGAETPNEFCAGIKRILCDPELAAGLGAEGRRAVESTFGWARIGADLRTSYADLAASTQGATRSTDAPSQA